MAERCIHLIPAFHLTKPNIVVDALATEGGELSEPNNLLKHGYVNTEICLSSVFLLGLLQPEFVILIYYTLPTSPSII